MCAIDQPTIRFDSPVAQTSALTDLNILNVNEPQRIPNPCKINVTCDVTESDLCNDIIPPIAQQHLTYGATEEGLFYHIQSQADTTFLPKYDGVEDMMRVLTKTDLMTSITYGCYLVKRTMTLLLEVQWTFNNEYEKYSMNTRIFSAST